MNNTATKLVTQYGLEVTPVLAFFDEESGAFVGADCQRIQDMHIRYYRVDQLRASGGAVEVQHILESAPTKESTDSPRYSGRA